MTGVTGFSMKRCLLILALTLLACLAGNSLLPALRPGETAADSLFSARAETDRPVGLNSRDGKKDTRVRDMQQRLVDLGYLNRADGIFGPDTEIALKRFQSEWGIDVTGVLDEITEQVLFAGEMPLEEAARITAGTLDGINGDLRTLQNRLRRFGFMTGEADGEYTDQTRAAISAFQRYAVSNYGPDFDIPPNQEAELAVSLPLGATPTPEPAAMDAVTPAPTVRPYYAVDGVPTADLYFYLLSDRLPLYRQTLQDGDEGAEVLRVQRRLYVLGYLFDVPDGTYGKLTVEAVRFFQRRNGILPTGVADERTQIKLFGDSPILLEETEMPYYIKVSIADQRVYIYRWVDGEYDFLIKDMICSTGMGNSTPKGTFVSTGHRDVRWHYFVDFNCWAQYAFVIQGGILFHSILYNRPDESTLRLKSIKQLGHKASHGCVRLMPEDARWIYENCHRGQVIEIY